MEVSSGVLLYRNNNGVIEFFVCTPDGPYWKYRELWCFPKGHMENNETPFQTAIREFKEETSVKLSDNPIDYECFGMIKQNKKKNVYLFYKKYQNENLTHCYSNKCISIVNGIEIEHNEIKDYKWITLEEYKESGIKVYIPYLEKIIEKYGNSN